MLQYEFFRFRQEAYASENSVQGGQFSFLPPEHHYTFPENLKAIFIELEECVVLEVKGTVGLAGFHLELATEGIVFWQLYQFMNTAQLYLPHNLPISDNRCISFSTQAAKIPLLLNSGKQWLVLIGYKAKSSARLLKEFPMLGSLVYGEGDLGKSFFFEPDIGINHSLRDIWRRISQSDYPPFRGKAALLLDICRLLEIYCRELDRQSDQSERTRLALYHRALAYIHENLLDSINKHNVARGLGVSWRTLNRAFEGRPIKIADYIQSQKLNEAKNLLYKGEMTVDQIANLLNYPNRKYFSREFKKYFFQSPSAFKKEMEEFRKDYDKEK